jgi:UDP-N-acetylglucosamine--N-acetylmuramyl-(pentapeptide) pyrophosphoryl-undecaprenol N-acetylglucosamine transferase
MKDVMIASSMTRPPRVLVMAGGTGGHIFPALAVARSLRDKGWDVTWLGTPAGLESQLVPPHQIPIEWLSVSGLRGKGLVGILLGIPRLIKAIYQAVRVVQNRQPDVVIGFGGFVSFPGGLASFLMRRPLVIHEQNSIAGLTNRMLSLFSREVLTGFPDAFGQPGGNWLARILPVPRHSTWTGNPVRQEVMNIPAPSERFANRQGALKLLVVGGSQGARALNTIVPEAVGRIPEARRPQILHQAGAKLLNEMQDAYQKLGVQADVVPFIDDMAKVLSEADLVICRAGALTVSELAAVGVGSILVPFPAAVDDHQTPNAQFLSSAGAGLLIDQKQLNAQDLAALIQSLDRPRLLLMAEAARHLGRVSATEDVAQVVIAQQRHSASLQHQGVGSS